MKVSKEELMHIAKLADLKIKDNEIENYLNNLQDILNFAEVVNKAPIENMEETIGTNENYNVFRKDEIKDMVTICTSTFYNYVKDDKIDGFSKVVFNFVKNPEYRNLWIYNYLLQIQIYCLL